MSRGRVKRIKGLKEPPPKKSEKQSRTEDTLLGLRVFCLFVLSILRVWEQFKLKT